MKFPFLEYRSVLAYNRDAFLIENSDLLKTFIAIDGNFQVLIELPGTRRDRDQKSHISLVPFILLLQRQAHSAFDMLSADQSYQAWLLLRPGIEAVLIMGKWVDDPRNAKIWQDREKYPGTYQKTYTGKALRSASFVGSEQIQAVLRTINERFVHANIAYYHRHLNVGPGDPGYVKVVLSYFEDDTLQLVNVLAFLHLLLVMQEGLLALFNKLFDTQATLPVCLAVFRQSYNDRIETLAHGNDEYKAILSNLGAWSAS